MKSLHTSAESPLPGESGWQLPEATEAEAPLSAFERIVVRVGALAGAAAWRWHFGAGPFNAYDGHLAAQYDAPSAPGSSCMRLTPVCSTHE
jgi:hypothetical protein